MKIQLQNAEGFNLTGYKKITVEITAKDDKDALRILHDLEYVKEIDSASKDIPGRSALKYIPGRSASKL